MGDTLLRASTLESRLELYRSEVFEKFYPALDNPIPVSQIL